MNLYDMNKAGVGSLPAYTEAQWNIAETALNNWLQSTSKSQYYLLYNKDRGYFTLFKRAAGCPESFFNVLTDCINNLGELKSFELNENGDAFEIWITSPDNDTFVLYLFEFDQGVVYFG